MGKRYDWEVTPQNTPRFKEKRALVLLANGLFTLNLVIIAVCYPDNRKDSLICAALALVYAFIAIFDKRKVEWEWGSVITVCALCLLGSAAWIYKIGHYWYYIGYGIEVIIFTLAAVLMLKKKSAKRSGDRKLFVRPVWQCGKLDSYLSLMESNGYRLASTSWFGIMYFHKSAPKTVRYFCTYTCLKNRTMNGIEDELRSRYRANPIPTSVGTRQIHRLMDVTADLTGLEELRQKSLLRVIGERLFFAVILCVGFIGASAMLHLSALFCVAIIILILLVTYYTVGIISVCKR